VTDPIAGSFYELMFRSAFREKKADEFQAFFSTIMEMRYPADFVRVRPWGAAGDWKNDGYLRSKRMLFQCYAPNSMRPADCVSKITEDFKGALPHWRQFFDV
jgi:hypothetical protein